MAETALRTNENIIVVMENEGDTYGKVRLEYDATKSFQNIMETCQNMVKITTDANGEPLVDEYAMDEDTPTRAMKQQMLDNTMADIMQLLSYLTDEDYEATEFTTDLEAEVPKIVLTLKYTDSYKDSQMNYMYDAIKGLLTYGILNQWFTAVNQNELKSQSMTEYSRMRDTLLRAIKPLMRKLRFADIANYTL